jgi:hypothetical protein
MLENLRSGLERLYQRLRHWSYEYSEGSGDVFDSYYRSSRGRLRCGFVDEVDLRHLAAMKAERNTGR